MDCHTLVRAAMLSLSAGALAGGDKPVIEWNSGEAPRGFERPDDGVTIDVAKKLHGAKAATLAAWAMPRRSGEQAIVARGMPEIGPGGERFFKPAEGWANFFIGTDARGLLMGCINGNSRMPFPLVTLETLTPGEWHHVVVVKQADGWQRFHHNGVLVYTDKDAEASGHVWPFIDQEPGEPLRVSLLHGGAVAEATVWARELSAEEVRTEWETKRGRFLPNTPAQPVSLQPMHEHPPAKAIVAAAGEWGRERQRIYEAWRILLGPMPETPPPLKPDTHGETDCGSYIRRKVSFQVQPDDRMPCWLLVPKNLLRQGKAPAVICLYGTTSGAGKDTTVGLSGGRPGTPPAKNRAFAVDMVEAGFIALAPDLLRDGERLPPSGRPYDTADFYARFQNWSCVGKDCWDLQRAVDFLATLPFIDGERIGVVGHSYGGHTAIFAAGLESRIKAVFASGPVSDFVRHGSHWAVPRGASNSQSLPALRPFLLEHRTPPVTFAEVTALIAPRPLWVNQAAGEWRPNEEENAAAVSGLYRQLGAGDAVRYMWCAGDHDFPPSARAAAVDWFKKWLSPL